MFNRSNQWYSKAHFLSDKKRIKRKWKQINNPFESKMKKKWIGGRETYWYWPNI